MRTISTAQNELLKRQNYKTLVKVQVEDMDGILQDLTNFEGRNWVRSFKVTRSTDNEVASAVVVLHSKEFFLNMAPLDADSKLNLDSGGSPGLLLDVSRNIIIQTRNVPLGVTSVTFVDDDEIFEGKTGKIGEQSGLDGSEIVISARDGQNEHTEWIERIETYGSDANSDFVDGTGDVENIIQDLLDNWTAGPTILHTPVTPGFVIPGPWEVTKQNILAACRQAAGAIGWECRYRWRNSTSQYELTLYEPDRTPAVDRAFALGEIITINNFERNSDDIRNAITVSYYTDPEDITTFAEVNVSDATSIAAYGRRWAAIGEVQSSPINTNAEATRLANAALADMKDPDLIGSAPFMFFPFAELGDYYTLPADKIHFSADQSVAVRAIEHSVDVQSGRAQTVIGFQINPSMGRIWWKHRFQIPGIGAIVRDKIPTTPIATLDVFDHGINVTWDTPIIPVVHYYEVHQSVTGGFTPSASTLIQRTQANRYRSNENGSGGGMDQRTTYFFKIVAVDKWGNKSAVSAQVSDIPGYLRGFPGILSTTDPDESTLRPGQLVLSTAGGLQGQVLRRWDKTYQDLALQTTTQEPTAYYKQNESAGPTATDESSNGNDGTYSAGVSFTQGPIVPNGAGNCAGYFGTHRIDLDNLNLLAQTAISWEAWLELSAAVGGGYVASTVFNILDCDNAAGVSQFQSFFQSAATKKAALLNVRIKNLLVNFPGVTPSDFMNDGPVHMAITWDNGDGLVHVYRNGVLLASSVAVNLGGTIDIDDCTFFNDQAGASSRPVNGISDHMIFWVGAEIPIAEIRERVDLASQPDVRYDRVTPVTQVFGKYFNLLNQVGAVNNSVINFDAPVIERGMTMTVAGGNAGRLTINESGWYHIEALIVGSAATAAAFKILRVSKNGASNSIIRGPRVHGSTAPLVPCSGYAYLKATDFIEIAIVLSSGSITILSSSEASTRGYLAVNRVFTGMGQN